MQTQSRFGTFHQLVIIVGALTSQTVIQLVKQANVARRGIVIVRKVVKQLPAEMFQQ
jgi:hypothetical protein